MDCYGHRVCWLVSLKAIPGVEGTAQNIQKGYILAFALFSKELASSQL